jgi:hypothetical protein
MKKNLVIEIRKIAKKLPLSYIEGQKYSKKEIIDLRERESKNNMFGQSVEQSISKESEFIIVKGETLFPVNHERRLKRAYEREGVQGIKDYYKWVDSNNKRLNAKYEQKIVMHLVDAKLKASISEIF